MFWCGASVPGGAPWTWTCLRKARGSLLPSASSTWSWRHLIARRQHMFGRYSITTRDNSHHHPMRWRPVSPTPCISTSSQVHTTYGVLPNAAVSAWRATAFDAARARLGEQVGRDGGCYMARWSVSGGYRVDMRCYGGCGDGVWVVACSVCGRVARQRPVEEVLTRRIQSSWIDGARFFHDTTV